MENEVSFPTGILKLKELMWILNSLPIEMTFVDKDDTENILLIIEKGYLLGQSL